MLFPEGSICQFCLLFRSLHEKVKEAIKYAERSGKRYVNHMNPVSIDKKTGLIQEHDSLDLTDEFLQFIHNVDIDKSDIEDMVEKIFDKMTRADKDDIFNKSKYK